MSIVSFSPGATRAQATATARIDEVRSRVCALLPRDDQGVLPLCHLIAEQIQSRYRDLDPTLVRLVLREVTQSAGYLERIRAEKWRYNLDGESVEPIQRYQREFADAVLGFRYARVRTG